MVGETAKGRYPARSKTGNKLSGLVTFSDFGFLLPSLFVHARGKKFPAEMEKNQLNSSLQHEEICQLIYSITHWSWIGNSPLNAAEANTTAKETKNVDVFMVKENLQSE